jgi:hypothetical protein
LMATIFMAVVASLNLLDQFFAWSRLRIDHKGYSLRAWFRRIELRRSEVCRCWKCLFPARSVDLPTKFFRRFAKALGIREHPRAIPLRNSLFSFPLDVRPVRCARSAWVRISGQ